MKKYKLLTVYVVFVALAICADVSAHCEIPCGIYNDEMRIDMINEDILTIQKSMKAIIDLERHDDHVHYNQIVRWIINKDNHADKIQETVTQYFMTQRIKPRQKNYSQMLELLHQMLLYSMKCKQTTDLHNTEELNKVVNQFQKLYFNKDKKD